MTWEPLPSAGGPRPSRLGDTLDRVLAGLGAPPASTAEVVQQAWADLVGPAAAANLQPRSIQAGRLVVTATDPVWAGQARWLEDAVVEGLERLLGPGVVTGLDARVETRRRG